MDNNLGREKDVRVLRHEDGKDVVFGRNVWQYREPAKMVMAYNEIVHGSGKAREAMKKLK